MKLIDIIDLLDDNMIFIFNRAGANFEGYAEDTPYRLLEKTIYTIDTHNIAPDDEYKNIVLRISVE